MVAQNRIRNLSNGEKAKKRNLHVKVYYNFDFFVDDNVISSKFHSNKIGLERTTTNFGHFSVALALEKTKSVHEIELSRINVFKNDYEARLFKVQQDTNQIVNGQNASMFRLNIRYEYSRKLINSNRKCDFMLGASLEPYIKSFTTKPKRSDSYPYKYTQIGAKMQLVARGVYNISKKVYIDLNLPFEIFNFRRSNSRYDNPTLPYELQNISEYRLDFFNNPFHFRIGVGIKI